MSISKDNVTSEAFIGRGEVFLTPVIGGVEQETFWVGVASSQTFNHEVSDKKEMYEWHQREQVLWDSSKGKTKTTMTMTIDERRKDAMAAALRAKVELVPEKQVTDEEYTPIGKLFFLKNRKLSAVTVVDGDGAPLAEDVDFELDAAYGQVKLLKENLVMPLKFTYSSGETEKMLPATNSVDYYIVRTKGFNTVGDEDDHLVTAYKYKMDIASALELITDDFSSVDVSGECLFATEEGGSYSIEKLS